MTDQSYKVITITNNVIIMVFQLLLILIFNKLISAAVQGRKRQMLVNEPVSD